MRVATAADYRRLAIRNRMPRHPWSACLQPSAPGRLRGSPPAPPSMSPSPGRTRRSPEDACRPGCWSSPRP